MKTESRPGLSTSHSLPTPGRTNIVSHSFFARLLCCELDYGSECLPSLRENDKMRTEVGIWGLKLGGGILSVSLFAHNSETTHRRDRTEAGRHVHGNQLPPGGLSFLCVLPFLLVHLCC